MELAEPIETLNERLIAQFGIDSITSQPMWRIVWSEDQFEKRMMDVTDEGISLLTPEVRTVPKYRQWIQEKYVLENLVIVPEVNRKELADIKVSYEPIFVFEDKNSNYLPPHWDVCKLVIDTLLTAKGGHGNQLAKYKYNPEQEAAKQEARISKLEEHLYGDKSDVSDALHYREGVALPHKHFGDN